MNLDNLNKKLCLYIVLHIQYRFVPGPFLLPFNNLTIWNPIQMASKGIVFVAFIILESILMKNIIIMAVVAVGITSLVSCQKDPLKELTPAESRIYITNHDSTVSFAEFKTFSVADSVAYFEDNQVVGQDLSEFDAASIAAVKAAMQSRGFQLVTRNDSPDLGITVSRIYSTQTGIMSYPGYWDTYGGYYDPFYWGYGGLDYYDPIYYGPNYYTTYQITQGALSVDILNLKDAVADNAIHPVWSGIARGTGVFSPSAAEGEINSFFELSPYLVTNQ